MILSGMFIAFMDLTCCGKGSAGSHRATEWVAGIVGFLLFNGRKNNHAGRDISGIFHFVIENCPVPFHPPVFSIVRYRDLSLPFIFFLLYHRLEIASCQNRRLPSKNAHPGGTRSIHTCPYPANRLAPLNGQHSLEGLGGRL